MVCGEVLHHLITPFHWHGVRKTLWATDSLIKKRKMGRSAGFNKSSAGPTVFPTHSNTSSFSSFFSLCLRLPIKRKKLVSREATTLKERGKKNVATPLPFRENRPRPSVKVSWATERIVATASVMDFRLIKWIFSPSDSAMARKWTPLLQRRRNNK